MTIKNIISCPNGVVASRHQITRFNYNLHSLFADVYVESYVDDTALAAGQILDTWQFTVTPQYKDDGTIVPGSWPFTTTDLIGNFITYLKTNPAWSNLTTV